MEHYIVSVCCALQKILARRRVCFALGGWRRWTGKWVVDKKVIWIIQFSWNFWAPSLSPPTTTLYGKKLFQHHQPDKGSYCGAGILVHSDLSPLPKWSVFSLLPVRPLSVISLSRILITIQLPLSHPIPSRGMSTRTPLRTVELGKWNKCESN